MPGTHYMHHHCYTIIWFREKLSLQTAINFCYYFCFLDNLVSGLWKSAFTWLLTLLIIIVVFGRAQALFHRPALHWGLGVTFKSCQSSCGFSQHQGMHKLKHNSCETSFFFSVSRGLAAHQGGVIKRGSMQTLGSPAAQGVPCCAGFRNNCAVQGMASTLIPSVGTLDLKGRKH